MNRNEWVVAVRTYNAFWPNGPLASADGVEVWFRKLGRFDQRRVLVALDKLAESSTYPPKVAEVIDPIRREMNREALETPALPAGKVVSDGEVLWTRITAEERRECVELALAEEGPAVMAKEMGWTVENFGPLILIGARWHALRLHGTSRWAT